MNYRFERDFLTIIMEVIEKHGCSIQRVPSKHNDYNILENGHVFFL
jgi:hypothetical protein